MRKNVGHQERGYEIEKRKERGNRHELVQRPKVLMG